METFANGNISNDDILYGDKLIAKFCNINVTEFQWRNHDVELIVQDDPDDLPDYENIEYFNPQADWSLLMNVVDKIEQIDENNTDSKYNFHFQISKRLIRVIYNWSDYITFEFDKKLTKEQNKVRLEKYNNSYKEYRICLYENDKRKACYMAVIDFLEWWNEEIIKNK